MRKDHEKIPAIDSDIVASHMVAVHFRNRHILYPINQQGHFAAAWRENRHAKGCVSGRIRRLPAILMKPQRGNPADIQGLALAAPRTKTLDSRVQGSAGR